MSRDSEDRWSERADRADREFAARPVRTGLKWFFGAVAIIILITIVFGVISWVGSWGSEGARIIGVDNTKEQVTRVLELDKSMTATATNICNAKNSKHEEADPSMVEDPAFAYKATYNNQKAEYDRRMQNLFEAAATRKIIQLPATIHHLPRTAPTVRQRQRLEGLC